MNTVSNLLVFTCNHTSCCCSQHCSAQACQQPHVKCGKFFHTVFFPLQVQGQWGRKMLFVRTQPAWPHSCSTMKLRWASTCQLLGYAPEDAVQRTSWSPGSRKPILKAVTLSMPSRAAWNCPGGCRCSEENPVLLSSSAPAWGVPCFPLKQYCLILPPIHRKKDPISEESGPFLYHAYYTPWDTPLEDTESPKCCDFSSKIRVLIAEAQIWMEASDSNTRTQLLTQSSWCQWKRHIWANLHRFDKGYI